MEEEVRKGYGGKDSLPAALCGAKLAGPLPLIKGDSFFDSRAAVFNPQASRRKRRL